MVIDLASWFRLENQQDFGKLFSSLNSILDGLEEEKLKLTTGFAGLLGKIAYADKEICRAEISVIKQQLIEQGLLDEACFERVLEVLQKHASDLAGIEDHHYWKLLNEVCGKKEKLTILESLFLVAAANHSISNEEERELRLIAKGLNIEDIDYRKIRVQFREHLDITK